MDKLRQLITKCSGLLCMAAMLVAIHSVNVTCAGKYYQPIVPKALDKFSWADRGTVLLS